MEARRSHAPHRRAPVPHRSLREVEPRPARRGCWSSPTVEPCHGAGTGPVRGGSGTPSRRWTTARGSRLARGARQRHAPAVAAEDGELPGAHLARHAAHSPAGSGRGPRGRCGPRPSGGRPRPRGSAAARASCTERPVGWDCQPWKRSPRYHVQRATRRRCAEDRLVPSHTMDSRSATRPRACARGRVAVPEGGARARAGPGPQLLDRLYAGRDQRPDRGGPGGARTSSASPRWRRSGSTWPRPRPSGGSTRSSGGCATGPGVSATPAWHGRGRWRWWSPGWPGRWRGTWRCTARSNPVRQEAGIAVEPPTIRLAKARRKQRTSSSTTRWSGAVGGPPGAAAAVPAPGSSLPAGAALAPRTAIPTTSAWRRSSTAARSRASSPRSSTGSTPASRRRPGARQDSRSASPSSS